MKKFIFILIVFFLSGTVRASNNLEVKIPAKVSNNMEVKSISNFEIKKVKIERKSTVFLTQVVTTFTDQCGYTWTVTTTCSCSVNRAYDIQGSYIHDNMDYRGCFAP